MVDSASPTRGVSTMNEINFLGGRRDFLKSGSVAVAASMFAFDSMGFANWTSPTDEPSVHNMLIVGQNTVFLSHLPMFSEPGSESPHRYQVILEASFSRPDADPQAQYAADRAQNPTTRIYTLNPERFVLPNLVSGGRLTSFKAKVFRGHLEKEGTEILDRVDVNIRNVVHFREFDPKAKKPIKLEYLLFGKGEELFLAHFITKPPDFDQVISVTAAGQTFSDEELRKGIHVVFANRPNSILKRLMEKQEAVAQTAGPDTKAPPVNVKFKAGAELYLEEGELRVPATFDQTAAERKAGFP
jgi:hypothetical protein